MASKSSNSNLHRAAKVKNDEFYTQLADIEKELRHYKDQFKGKVVYCNCDDPFESNFFKYFAGNFNALGLKRLIATSYRPSPIANTQLGLFDSEEVLSKSKGRPKITANKFIINDKMNAGDKFAFGMKLGLSKYYSDAISDNVKRTFELKRRKGEWTGPVRLGYLNVPLDEENRTRKVHTRITILVSSIGNFMIDAKLFGVIEENHLRRQLEISLSSQVFSSAIIADVPSRLNIRKSRVVKNILSGHVPTLKRFVQRYM